MKRNKMSIVLYVLLAFAAIGLISQLFGNTANFLMRILIAIGIAVVIFAVLNYFMQQRGGGSSNEMKKYKQAVKQSKMKYQPTSETKKNPVNMKQNNKDKPKQKRRFRHLRVIDGGSKPKDKDKAASK